MYYQSPSILILHHKSKIIREFLAHQISSIEEESDPNKGKK
jgi:hypothetical protein